MRVRPLRTLCSGLLLALALVPSTALHAQQTLLRGLVADQAGTGIGGAAVTLVGADSVEVITAADGSFSARLAGARVRVRTQQLGFAMDERVVELRDNMPVIRIVLEPAAIRLDQLDAAAAELRRERPVAATAVDARAADVQMVATADLVDRATGVRVRQSGGVGSRQLLSIHGLSGRQVRTFVDGLPSEFLGAAASMAALPASALERVEVYKGAVPSELGGDALGGALNFVTRAPDAGVRMALSAGSYGALNGSGAAGMQVGGVSVGLNAAHVRARNDYRMDVTIPDAAGQPQPARVRRFHDGYTITRAAVDLRSSPVQWADALRLQLFGAAEHRELQHAAVMAQPYGAATTGETGGGVVLSWQKQAGRLSAGIDAGHSRQRGTFTDTTLNVYAWDGTISRRRDYGGEISSSRNMLRLDTRNDMVRGSAGVSLAAGIIRLHVLHLGTSRVGQDSVAAAYYGDDPFRYPSDMTRNVAGLSWEASMLRDQLRTELAIKHYAMDVHGFGITPQGFLPSEPQHHSRNGVMAGVSWSASPGLLLKLSGERATRLPDSHEVLGDFAVVRPNPLLRPEVSTNVNVAAELGRQRFRLELGGFLRETDDIVYLRTSQFFSIHENLLKSRSHGLELALSALPTTNLAINGALTWQDVRNRSPVGQSSSVADRYFNARLPNIPVLFGNAQAVATLERSRGTMRSWWSSSYVQEFFLHWEVDGRRDSKAVIPTQLAHNLGVSLTSASGNVQLLGEIQNITNARTYDVYSIPRPGRSLQLGVQFRLHAGRPSH